MKNLVALLLALLTCVTASVSQAGWPDQRVRLIVPAPAGSSLDAIARALSEKLHLRWKQPVVVENRAGAGGLLGMDAVAKARPDGLTLGLGFNGPIASEAILHRRRPYDPATDLIPVVLVTSQPNVLAVPFKHPADDLPAFLDWARRQGDNFTYSSVGRGSSSHLTMERLRKKAGLRGVHVPYPGSPAAGLSLASGETQALFAV